jgi:hypothetical protein
LASQLELRRDSPHKKKKKGSPRGLPFLHLWHCGFPSFGDAMQAFG